LPGGDRLALGDAGLGEDRARLDPLVALDPDAVEAEGLGPERQRRRREKQRPEEMAAQAPTLQASLRSAHLHRPLLEVYAPEA
jgi:hypothetical protein